MNFNKERIGIKQARAERINQLHKDIHIVRELLRKSNGDRAAGLEKLLWLLKSTVHTLKLDKKITRRK